MNKPITDNIDEFILIDPSIPGSREADRPTRGLAKRIVHPWVSRSGPSNPGSREADRPTRGLAKRLVKPGVSRSGPRETT